MCMKKFFTLFIAALMSVGMWAEPITVTWNNDDISGSGNSFTKDGVTLTCGMNIDWDDKTFLAGGTFTTNLGNFTKIEVTAVDCGISGEGWSGSSAQKTWTGNSASVSYSGEIMSMGMGVTFVFTIEEPAPSAKYYVVGDMTNWAVNENYEMTPNNAVGTEEYMYDITLTTANQFKVVKVEGETQTWYPDGMGNNYGENGEITRDGNYTIYFRPNGDGGEGWFYGYIYADIHLEYEDVILGALLPENGKPANGVNLVGTFSLDPIAMELVVETGAYAVFDLVADGGDTFTFVDADNEDNYLVMRNAAGEWVPAVFTCSEVWEDDTWKGEPVKMIDLDLTDNSKYAWSTDIPEGLDEVQSDKAACTKVMLNGKLYIIRDGKMYNALGAEVK